MMPVMFTEPAASIIEIVGGASALARHLGTSPSSPLRWRLPREKGGTDGFIPAKYHDRIIALAAAQELELPRAAFVDPAVAKDLLARVKRDQAA